MMHNSVVQFLLCLGVLAILGFMYLRISRINQFFFFGRTLPASFVDSPAAKEITNSYLRQMKTGLLMSLALFVILGSGKLRLTPLGGLDIVVLYQFLFFNIRFARGHREAGEAFRRSGLSVRETDGSDGVVAVPLLRREEEPTPGILQLLLPAMLACGVWAAILKHFGLAGLEQAVGSKEESFLIGMSMGILGAATLLQLLLRFTARQRTPLARRSARLSLWLAWIAVAVFGGAALAMVFHYQLAPAVVRALVLVLAVVALAQMLYAWTQKARYAPHAAERNGDEFWKWGLYYHNPNDPALFVQSRCWLGYTLNFANVFSWPIAMAVFADFGFLFLLTLRR